MFFVKAGLPVGRPKVGCILLTERPKSKQSQAGLDQRPGLEAAWQRFLRLRIQPRALRSEPRNVLAGGGLGNGGVHAGDAGRPATAG